MVGDGRFLLIRLVVLIRLVFRAVLVVLGVFHPSYFSRPSRPRGLGWLERAIGFGFAIGLGLFTHHGKSIRRGECSL